MRRGVLIDYYAYAVENGITYDPWSYHPIPLSTIKKIAEEKGIEFRKGDILFLRTGTNLYARVHPSDTYYTQGF